MERLQYNQIYNLGKAKIKGRDWGVDYEEDYDSRKHPLINSPSLNKFRLLQVYENFILTECTP